MFAKFFIDRPIFAWVIALVILLAGILALRVLPVAQYPAVAPPSIAFNIVYPGASAKVVESTVTSLIEQEMNGIERLLYMESSSELGTGTVTLTFQPGTNIDIASVEAQNRFKRVEARLPDDVRRVGVPVTKPSRNYVMFVSLYSPDNSHSGVDLGSFAAAAVLDPLRRVKGVGEALMFGTEYSMRLWLKPEKLQAYSLSPADVSRAVRAQNVELAAGELGQAPAVAGQQMNAVIVTRSRLATPEEFGNVLIRTQADGSALRVKDVARVELGSQSYDIMARLNGQPNAAIAIRVSPDGNALDVVRAVRAKMEEMAPTFPKGITWDVPYDTSRFVDISIKEVMLTLAEAMLLVFLVIYLFLENFRATLIPAIVVPVALTGALAGLYVFGYSINVLTLFAMVLAVGIVVDDAIVVVEAVERIMNEEGLAPREAARKAMDQIFNAIIGITLVLSSVFAPMLFFGGSVGVIYRQFAMTLLLAMGFSILMALTLTPALCATLLKHEPGTEVLPSTGFFGVFNRFFDRTRTGYQSWVANMLPKTGRYLLIYAVIIVATGWLFMALPGSFLPDEDQGYFVNMIQLPPGASQERTIEVLSQVEQYYLKQPEVSKVIGVVGFSFFGRGQNAALAFVRLKEWDERPGAEHSANAVVQRANMTFFQIKQAIMFAINPPPIPELATTGGFDFRLQDRAGVGREKLLEARNAALGMAMQKPNLAGVRPEGQEAAPQLLLDIDRRKAETLGVSLADLNETLQSTLGVAYVNDFERQGRILRVLMQADATLRSTPEEMLRLPVRNRAGGMVPLAEIVTAQWTIGSPKLDRYNGLPSVKISGAPAPGRSTGDAMQAMESVAKDLPTGFGFEWSGTSFEEKLSGSQAPLLFALAMLVAFLALAALYESWSIPFAVMLVVPLGIFGSTLAVTLRGLPNDVYFKVGLIAIIGLSSKNAILIIEFARDLQERGMGLAEATLEACRLRFRPILMTSFAFILGVLPLAAVPPGRVPTAAMPSAPASSAACLRLRSWQSFWCRYFLSWCARYSPATPVAIRRAAMNNARRWVSGTSARSWVRGTSARRWVSGNKPLILVLGALLAGCSMIPEYHRPEPPVVATWVPNVPADATRQASSLKWRSVFPDPRLQALIAAAIDNNRDMRIAIARVEEARALFGIARADRLPSLDLVSSATSARTPGDLSLSGRATTSHRYDLGLSLPSFELDFWGRVKSLNEAALAGYLASVEARRAMRLALIADVANAYLSLLELDERTALARDTVASREQTRLMVSRRRDAGLASDLDYLQADGVLELTRAEMASLERQRAAALNALTLLVGREPPNLPPGRPLSDQGIVSDFAANTPAEVMLHRPDVLAAEQRLMAANANIGVARAAFLPRISLSAGAGTASSALSSLLQTGQGAWSLQPILRLPLFDSGRSDANVDLAEARSNIAVAEYEKTIQQMFREVADLLAAREQLAGQMRAQERARQSQSERLRLAEARYKAGISSYLEVLDAQREDYAAQQVAVQTRRMLLTTAAQLYKALGGGEEDTP